MAAPVLIELREVRKRFGGRDGVPEVEILHGIDLRIRAGEYVAIVGASGSGKTTLMNILGCLDRPSSGEYLFQGEAVPGLDDDALAALRREVFGFVFQGYHLIGTSSALDNVAMPARYAGVSEQARHKRAAALLSRLGLADRLQYLPHQLSGGQQQRVSIARALVNGGRVILADEPTGALDSTSGEQVMQQLDELAAAGHTLILITHDPAVAARARRIISMADGRIVGDVTAPVDGKGHPLWPTTACRSGMPMRRSNMPMRRYARTARRTPRHRQRCRQTHRQKPLPTCPRCAGAAKNLRQLGILRKTCPCCADGAGCRCWRICRRSCARPGG